MATEDEDAEYLKQNPIKGELDLLNLESLINVEDVARHSSKLPADLSKKRAPKSAEISSSLLKQPAFPTSGNRKKSS